MNSIETKANHVGNGPIRSKKHDQFVFSDLVDIFIKDHITTLSPKEGVRLGICAPWGHGKTSFINLLIEKIEKENPKPYIIHLNPWHLQHVGSSLVDIFFQQMASHFSHVSRTKQVNDVIDSIIEYSDNLSAIPLLPFVMQTVGSVKKARENIQAPYQKLYEKVSRTFRDLKSPVYIIIDDVDRLDDEEVRLLFKFIRQVADFDNVRYLVAYDPKLVGKMLTHNSVKGRDYLEKIIDHEFLLQPPIVARKIDYIVADVLQKDSSNFDKRTEDVLRRSGLIEGLSIRNITKIRGRINTLTSRVGGDLLLLDLILIEILKEKDVSLYNNIIQHLVQKNEESTSLEDIVAKIEDYFLHKGDRTSNDVPTSADRPLDKALTILLKEDSYELPLGTHRLRDLGALDIYLGASGENQNLITYNIMSKLIKIDESAKLELLKDLTISETIDVLECIKSRVLKIEFNTDSSIIEIIKSLLTILDSRYVQESRTNNQKLFFAVSNAINRLLTKGSPDATPNNNLKKFIETFLIEENTSLSSKVALTYGCISNSEYDYAVFPLDDTLSFKKTIIERTDFNNLKLKKEWALYMALSKMWDWSKEDKDSTDYPQLEWAPDSAEVNRVIETHPASTAGYQEDFSDPNGGGGYLAYIKVLSIILSLTSEETEKAVNIYNQLNPGAE